MAPPIPPQNHGWYYATGNPAAPLITINATGQINSIPNFQDSSDYDRKNAIEHT